jgi:iron complex transport system substrate-binding protein
MVLGLLGLLLSACASFGASANPAVQVTDEQGTTIRFARVPQRIVSLLPSLTETVCALGQCQRLVGIDRYSNYPKSVSHLPKVGGGLDPNIEAIVGLKPDLVLVAGSTRAADRLRNLGLTVMALEPKTHSDLQRAIRVLGQVLDVQDVDKVWRDIDDGVNAAARSVPTNARGLRVYFEVNPMPYAAGESSFIGETLARLGVKNIVPASMGPFPKLNPEYIVRADPDVIMVGDQDDVGIGNRPAWSSMRALKQNHVCVFTAEQSDTLVRPGPRLAQGAWAMAKCLERMAP